MQRAINSDNKQKQNRLKLIVFTLAVKKTTHKELTPKDNNTNLLALVNATFVRLRMKTKDQQRREKRGDERNEKGKKGKEKKRITKRTASQLAHLLKHLPIEERIVFKILLLTFKCLNGLAPPYLCDLIQLAKYVPRRNLRSINGHRLVDVGYKLTRYGSRSVSVASVKLWNALPLNIRSSDNLMQFKRNLKTHLFRKAFY